MIKPMIVLLTSAAILLSPFNQASAYKGTEINYESREEIPSRFKWKLHEIYPTKSAWAADVKKAEALAVQFKETYQGSLGQSASQIKKAMDAYTKLLRIEEKAYVYINLELSTNESNHDLQALSNRADTMAAAIAEKTAWFSPELGKIPGSQMEKYLNEPDLQLYKNFLADIIRTKPHTLSKEQEELLAKISPLSGTAANVYTMLSKDVRFPKIKDEKGKEVQLTRVNYSTYMESKNRKVRKAAYEAYYRTLTKFQDSFAAVMSAQVKSHNISADVRKYKSSVEAALTPNEIPAAVYDQLISSVHKGLPQMHRYMELKKKMLRVNDLHMYDMYTPIVDSNNKYIPFEEAKKMVIEGLKPLGKEYETLLNKSFSHNWVDVYSTEDKRTGAFQWGAYDTHPYVLLNYQGTKNDVSTLAHELGHAMHSYYSKKAQPYINSGNATFTAEVASTLNENLLWESEYKKAKTKKEKVFLLNQRLEDFRTTLFRQAQFAEFERSIHELEAKGGSLNAESLKKIYGDINKKYYGSLVAADNEIPMEWARIPHLYDYNFYVYQYATSFAASSALAKQVLDEGQPAVKRLKEKFLMAGGSSDPISILKDAGVDMSTSKPIEQSLQVFSETLDELEKLLNE
ncbi:oligoendopeptidase F [Peribacillus deserti]|uniref:Oligopeptidase F n=1 Tax=Peribacillus deserti TaxID=673318 RepID=A0ABS2QE19_9BACI|nr:oligoendopeptidase F [Peribacillus deserti]MBM7691275.1 oligoendopeptidase F [Peribacillus deserti]